MARNEYGVIDIYCNGLKRFPHTHAPHGVVPLLLLQFALQNKQYCMQKTAIHREGSR